ncbi:Asp23/Gls24 family envelope stress response protein [Eupransor demetentiae]|uniref:Alkaline shock protein (Asp23) family (YloU) n=1 Tax=Eupransor demetentiae TaxID=3109584 RepID=A0ABM9N398_9LACO|nr:Uncharacterized conserved protein YloU [Lactobacillaceae bacterium LMG 33000]
MKTTKHNTLQPKNFVLPNQDDLAGLTYITPAVIEVIAQKATEDVDGVYSMRGKLSDSFAPVFGPSARGRGVALKRGEDGLEITLYVFLRYGVTVPQVAMAIQQAVISQIASMTGMMIDHVNVSISGIVPEKDGHAIDPKHMFDKDLEGADK